MAVNRLLVSNPVRRTSIIFKGEMPLREHLAQQEKILENVQIVVDASSEMQLCSSCSGIASEFNNIAKGPSTGPVLDFKKGTQWYEQSE